MQQTPCDECGKPITSKARLEAGISFCSEVCEFEDERKNNAKLGLQNFYQFDRYDEMTWLQHNVYMQEDKCT
jgi:predicted nucleic acid-binding Zn ribbon protein